MEINSVSILKIDGEVAKSNRLDIVDTDFEYTVSGLNTYITSLEEDKELLGDLQNLATQAIINKEAVFLSKPQGTPQKTFDKFVLNQIKNAKSENYVYTDIAE